MPTLNQIREILEGRPLLEKLADIEHERWSHWQQYVHEQCERMPDGSLVIPADLAKRWEKQMGTPYSKLTDDEKESDREQVNRYVPTIIRALSD